MGNVSLKVLEKSLNFCSKMGTNPDNNKKFANFFIAVFSQEKSCQL